MEKIKIAAGIYYLDIPEADLRILCACPGDSVKHLKKRGIIVTKEKNGVSYETGPNAILLSDVTIQHGGFSNLAEFPVMHMFYKQGMIVPGHPNNTGRKPLLIGTKAQIIAQSRYIYRGNYGLTSLEEIMAAGIERSDAEEMMRMKMKFAYGAIRKTNDLIDYRIVDNSPIEISGGVTLSRTGPNTYLFRRGEETCEVDLNLGRNEFYEKPYTLGYYQVKPEYFSVIHIGEGDGWDPNRPCMSSILTFQGQIYLIDAGPGILESLTALGISINEVDGIFHTHCHDDHFAGLTSLIRADHRINHYATPLVRASIIRKFSALMSLEEEKFADYFNICNLNFDEWNRIGGLEVMPVFSAHPVETSIMYFRTAWSGGYKTYAHLADIVSLDVLDEMLTRDGDKSGISPAFYEKFRSTLFIPADVKKIDAGKGLIHGNTVDFAADKSGKIIMSHSSEEFSLKEKEIGSTTAFGQADVLIPSRQDFSMKTASSLLRAYFPNMEQDFIRMFLDCPMEEFSPGSIVLRKGMPNPNIYLLLNGVAEAVNADLGVSNALSSGALIGDVSFLEDTKADFTYRAVSPIRVLQIPGILFDSVSQEIEVFDEIKRLHANRLFLLQTDLFGEMLSFPVQNQLARIMKKEKYPAGTNIGDILAQDILLLEKGKVDLRIDDKTIGTIEPKGFLGAEGTLFGTSALYLALAAEDVECYRVPGSELKAIPIIQMKLMENFKKGVSGFFARFSFRWEARYETGIKEADKRRRELFRYIQAVSVPIGGEDDKKKLIETFGGLAVRARKNFTFTENLLKSRGRPCPDIVLEERKNILDTMDRWHERLRTGGRGLDIDFLEYLNGWIFTHTIDTEKKLLAAL
jgi:hemerythrin